MEINRPQSPREANQVVLRALQKELATEERVAEALDKYMEKDYRGKRQWSDDWKQRVVGLSVGFLIPTLISEKSIVDFKPAEEDVEEYEALFAGLKGQDRKAIHTVARSVSRRLYEKLGVMARKNHDKAYLVPGDPDLTRAFAGDRKILSPEDPRINGAGGRN